MLEQLLIVIVFCTTPTCNSETFDHSVIEQSNEIFVDGFYTVATLRKLELLGVEYDLLAVSDIVHSDLMQ